MMSTTSYLTVAMTTAGENNMRGFNATYSVTGPGAEADEMALVIDFLSKPIFFSVVKNPIHCGILDKKMT